MKIFPRKYIKLTFIIFVLLLLILWATVGVVLGLVVGQHHVVPQLGHDQPHLPRLKVQEAGLVTYLNINGFQFNEFNFYCSSGELSPHFIIKLCILNNRDICIGFIIWFCKDHQTNRWHFRKCYFCRKFICWSFSN